MLDRIHLDKADLAGQGLRSQSGQLVVGWTASVEADAAVVDDSDGPAGYFSTVEWRVL
jgi:hypothetical protein